MLMGIPGHRQAEVDAANASTRSKLTAGNEVAVRNADTEAQAETVARA
jgi:hypothetical protein